MEKDHVGTRRINKVSVPDIAVFLCVKVDGLEDLIEELTCPAHEGFALKRDERHRRRFTCRCFTIAATKR